MKPELFIKKYKPFADEVENLTGISSVFLLAQSALESGWGDKAIGNMMFGVKDTDGLNGNEQLIVTTEYLRNKTTKFPKILKIIQVGKQLYKYTVMDYFRKYDSPKDSFLDHANFILENKRYKKALEVKGDPYKFADEIAKAGYATAGNYRECLHDVIDSIKRRL